MENKLLLVGAFGAFFLATAATLVSDMHGIGDWFISSMQVKSLPLAPANIYSAPYTIAGRFGEPLLILSIAMIVAGLFGCWQKYHVPAAIVAMIIGCLYILERVFWSYVTLNFANSILAHTLISDYTVLSRAGLLKGIGALLGGLIGGFGFTTALTFLFFRIHNPFGIVGGIIVLATMLIGMPAKIFFMEHVNSLVLTIFILCMVFKNFGIVFMGVGLIRETFK